MKILEMIDIFGKQINLNYNKSNKINSAIGGFFTITLYLLLLVSIWLIGNDITYKENPTSSTEFIISPSSIAVDLNISTFHFALV